MGSITKALGIGTYTTKDGKVISYDDLPDDVKVEVDRRGSHATLNRMGSMAGGSDPKLQKAVNELYDPATRDEAMRERRMANELQRRLSKRDK
jgi:hypothetical protein